MKVLTKIAVVSDFSMYLYRCSGLQMPENIGFKIEGVGTDNHPIFKRKLTRTTQLFLISCQIKMFQI